MRRSLGEDRVTGIKDHVEGGGYFPCHQTTGRRHELEAEFGWEQAPIMDKLDAIAREQPCYGARVWAEEQRELDDRDQSLPTRNENQA